MVPKQHRVIAYLFIVMLIITVIWTIQILNGDIPFVDQWTRELVGRFEGTAVYRVFLEITNLGSRTFLIPFVVVASLALWIWYKKFLPVIFFSLGTLLTHRLNILIKNIIERERPSILEEARAVGHSFPSGHAMVSMVCYGLLTYFITKKLKSSKAIVAIQISFSFLILLIGISRYVINVHYLTDVLAGFIIGFIFLIGLLYLYGKIKDSVSRTEEKYSVSGSE